jgi:hypothetical protein
MLKRIATIGLGTAIVLTPLAALAQTGQAAAPAASARSAALHKTEARHKGDTGRERAALAKHMHRTQRPVQP